MIKRVTVMGIKTITICGGGNASHALIPVLRKKFDGNINLFLPFQNEVTKFNHLITNGIINATFGSETFSGSPSKASNIPDEVCADAELILLLLPAFAHESILKEIIPFVKKNAIIGAIPSRGGFEFSSLKILKVNKREDIKIFGMQTLPWACRIKKYASQVEILGQKDSIGLATFPHENVFDITKTLTNLLSINIKPLPNMLTLTLANIGQIVHPGIMYGLFKGNENRKYRKEEIPLFYQGVTEEIAQILEEMSNEILKLTREVKKIFKNVNLANVLSLKEWLITSYANSIIDKTTLKTCFVTNRAYQGLSSPMREIENGYFQPDFQSRYLTEDVPYGLVVTKAIALLAEVQMPIIDEVIVTTSKWMGREYLTNGYLKGKDIKETRIPQNYGIKHIERFINL